MGGIVYQYHSVLHFPTFSSFSNQPKFGKPIFSLKDIADVSSPFERKGLKLSVTCNGSDEGNRRGQSSRRSTGRTAKNDETKKPRGGRKSKSSNQEEIISLFRRIQSSISKEVESVDTKKIKSDASEEKPPSAESILRVLQGGSTKQREEAQPEGQKVDMKEQQKQANPSVTDFKLTRPPSKFVKRSPIPTSSHMSSPPGELLETKNGASGTTAGTEMALERVEEMKLPELKELAKSRGIRGYSKLKKKELVELLIS